jgi:spore maturation protein CgeB
VRLFEAAASGAPIISDWWPGLDTIFVPGSEILIARDGDAVLRYLREMSEPDRLRLAEAARARVLAAHTAEHRAIELEDYLAGIAEAAGTPDPAPEPARNLAEMPR